MRVQWRVNKTNLLYSSLIFFLVLAGFLPFSGALYNGFVDWDDMAYVVNNPYVHELSWTNLKAVFTGSVSYINMYCPLVLCSFMLEYVLRGPDPFIFHLTSLILHTFNVLLVFWFVLLLVDDHDPDTHFVQKNMAAAFAAVFFAVHPVHVESIAWVTSRKDLLSGFFFLLTLICYLKYMQQGRREFYLAAFMCSIGALLSKASAVSIPFCLLLLDWRSARGGVRTVLDKLPFFGVSIGFGLLAVHIQKMSMTSFCIRPIPERILVSLKSVSLYLVNTFIPIRLSALYPYPGHIRFSDPDIIAAAAFIILIGTITLLRFRNAREFVFGILFFGVTIAPALKLFPRNSYEYAADRFMYIPLIGLVYPAAWYICRLFDRIGAASGKIFLAIILTGLILTLSFASYQRVRIWSAAEHIWEDVLAHYPDSALARNELGKIRVAQGRIKQGKEQLLKALRIKPAYPDPMNGLAGIYFQSGDFGPAEIYLRNALEISPDFVDARYNLGVLLWSTGHRDEAVAAFEEVVRLAPDHADAYNNLGVAFRNRGQHADAVRYFKKALSVDPAHENAGRNLALAGR